MVRRGIPFVGTWWWRGIGAREFHGAYYLTSYRGGRACTRVNRIPHV
jgi:hypothetical protein